MFERLAAAGAVIACASTFQAHAEPLLFKFTAEVAETNGWLSGVAVGDTFSGSFIYDSSTPGHELNPGAVEYVFARPNRVSFVVGGHTVNVGGVVAGVYSFDPGVGGVQLGASSALRIDGALFSDGYFAYQFGNWSAGSWLSTDLPTSYDVDSLGPAGENYGGLFANSTDGVALGFFMTDISVRPLEIGTAIPAVPEPSTLWAMSCGLGLVGFCARRRRWKHAPTTA